MGMPCPLLFRGCKFADGQSSLDKVEWSSDQVRQLFAASTGTCRGHLLPPSSLPPRITPATFRRSTNTATPSLGNGFRLRPRIRPRNWSRNRPRDRARIKPRIIFGNRRPTGYSCWRNSGRCRWRCRWYCHHCCSRLVFPPAPGRQRRRTCSRGGPRGKPTLRLGWYEADDDGDGVSKAYGCAIRAYGGTRTRRTGGQVACNYLPLR